MTQHAPDIRTKPPCSREDALAVLKRLREHKHIAYFAGGCVRDELLGRMPKDYDVATDAPPEQVRKLFARTQAVGHAFGVILVRHGSSVVEVATFRSDGSYGDGRRPDTVTFSTPEHDAQRRDFTINGLFLDPLDNGRVIDFVGGVADLQSRTLRAIGDPAHRFAEDHLRLLRAVRFAARFDLTVEPATAAAILRDAPLLKRISPERIADELRLALTPPTRSLAWRLLWEFRLGPTAFRPPPFSPAPATDPPRSLFLRVSPDAAIRFGLALAGAALDLQVQAGHEVRAVVQKKHLHSLVHSLRQSLKISNDESEEMQHTLEALGPLLADRPPTEAALKRFHAGPTADNTRRLLDALYGLGHHVPRIDELRPRLAALDGVDCAPAPLITGDDLTAAGLTPGPVFKRVLDAVYDAQLEGRIAGKAEGLAMALQLAGKPG
ncbi:MAG: CCA tRNA nucleotidyltransferase [Tepidisphaeraceae bacterium]